MSFACLDWMIEQGRGEQPALIYDSPVSSVQQRFTYLELKQQVARFAAGLRSLGIEKGDTVVIYMPMIPQAVVAMLACARIGAIHSVVLAVLHRMSWLYGSMMQFPKPSSRRVTV